MSAALIIVASLARLTAGTASAPIPVLCKDFSRGGDGSERMAAGRPCILEIHRDRDGTSGALDGTVAVLGANLPHPAGNNASHNRLLGSDGATANTVFTTTLTYAALANYNTVVIKNGTVLIQTTDYTVSDVGGFKVVTLGVAAADNDSIDIFDVTWTSLLADGANPFGKSQIVGKDLYKITGTHATNNLSKTLVTVSPQA